MISWIITTSMIEEGGACRCASSGGVHGRIRKMEAFDRVMEAYFFEVLGVGEAYARATVHRSEIEAADQEFFTC